MKLGMKLLDCAWNKRNNTKKLASSRGVYIFILDKGCQTALLPAKLQGLSEPNSTKI